MNKLLFLTEILVLLLASCQPDPEEILKKSFAKCQSIENGYYEMEHHMKFMDNKDTSLCSFNCFFKKRTNDTIFSSAFHYKSYVKGEFSEGAIYTGDDFVYYSVKDSTGKLMSKALWAEDIKAFSPNYIFYSPVSNKESYPLPKDSDYIDNEHIFQFLGEEMINDLNCYHIRMNTIPENDSAAMLKAIKIEENFWINKEDYIPIQYSIAFDLVMSNDTQYQFEKNVLTKYELDKLKDESPLKLSSIPSYVKLEDYVPYKSPELLPEDTIAPNWTLNSILDETYSLSDFKDKLVLLDFFYKSCYPCLLAIPGLQELHEKYEDQGLKVIGIDPYDTLEDDIIEFLSKRDVTYTVLLGGKDVAKEYHVSAYPTIYLIDKEGEIVFTQVGYSEESEANLEEKIKENL